MRNMTKEEKAIVLDGEGGNMLEQEVVQGLRGFCNAVNNLAQAERKLRAAYDAGSALAPIREERMGAVLLGLSRAVRHMAEAHGDLPDELWAVLLADSQATPSEIEAAILKSRYAA